MSNEGQVVVESSRFGRIEVEDSDILRFSGLPGFPGAKRFVVMDHDRESTFVWLVSMDDPDLAFVVTDPWQFFPAYELEVEAADLKLLEAAIATDVDVLSIVSFHGEQITLNLAAPILVNAKARRGIQIILSRGDYSVREALPKLDPPAEKAEGETEGVPAPETAANEA